jgi:integrase
MGASATAVGGCDGQPGKDFHALRNTFIRTMEGLEVAESTVKLLVGHKRTSMTYGHYSKGAGEPPQRH